MKIGGRELADESRKQNCHGQEWQGQAVYHQHQREAVIVHRKPVAEGYHHVRCSTEDEFPRTAR